MNHKAFVAYYNKIKPILQDCLVDSKTAETDPQKYTIYHMKTPANSNFKVSYDNEKLQKYIEDLRDICEIVPQIRLNSCTYVIPVGQLNDDDTLKQISSKEERIKKYKQYANTSETFLSMCVTLGIIGGIDQKPDKLSTIYGIMKERIRSRYQADEGR